MAKWGVLGGSSGGGGGLEVVYAKKYAQTTLVGDHAAGFTMLTCAAADETNVDMYFSASYIRAIPGTSETTIVGGSGAGALRITRDAAGDYAAGARVVVNVPAAVASITNVAGNLTITPQIGANTFADIERLFTTSLPGFTLSLGGRRIGDGHNHRRPIRMVRRLRRPYRRHRNA